MRAAPWSSIYHASEHLAHKACWKKTWPLKVMNQENEITWNSLQIILDTVLIRNVIAAITPRLRLTPALKARQISAFVVYECLNKI